MNVLAIGAHPDDVELGCGGALLRHARRGDHVSILVLTRGERGTFGNASRINEQQRAARLLGASLHWGGFQDGAVPTDVSAIDVIDRALAVAKAEVVYTHAQSDTHQDHRAAAVASVAAARRVPTVMFYETPSTQQFQPAVFIDIETTLDHKLELLRAHDSQVTRDGPVDVETLVAQARFRGSQSRLHHAEGFETSRFVWDMAAVAEPPPGVRSISGGIGNAASANGPRPLTDRSPWELVG